MSNEQRKNALRITQLARAYESAGLGAANFIQQEVRREGEFLDVVVVGRVKAGKSTFLNALLLPNKGYELPVSFKPLTSKPWCLTYSATPTDKVVAVNEQGQELEQFSWAQTRAVQADEGLWDKFAVTPNFRTTALSVFCAHEQPRKDAWTWAENAGISQRPSRPRWRWRRSRV